MAAYVAVFSAELAGDRTFFALGSLAARFRPGAVLAGAVPAIMGKMFVGVLLGSALALVPGTIFRVLSAATFLLLAVGLWRRPMPAAPEPALPMGSVPLAAFATLFFAEWGDPGQLAVALLCARSGAPMAVWTGGTLALLTKAVLATTLGVAVGQWLGQRTLRLATLAVYLALATLAVIPETR
jgi:putative Ca2+/H+ antiporter (TMEM165/GDT1 family)